MTKTLTNNREESILARTIAPEDLVRGDYVAVRDEIYQVPSYCWHHDAHVLPPQEPVRLQFHGEDRGLPLKVKAICLPFLLVKRPSGVHQTLDVRRCELLRLNRQYGRKAFKKLRKRHG